VTVALISENFWQLAAALEEMERMHTMIQGFELSVVKAEADARAANDAVLKVGGCVRDILQHATTHCNTLQRTATHWWVCERDTATHCNTVQHTATHCNALQRIATHLAVVKVRERERESVRVHVCVGVARRERERAREGDGESEREREDAREGVPGGGGESGRLKDTRAANCALLKAQK